MWRSDEEYEAYRPLREADQSFVGTKQWTYVATFILLFLLLGYEAFTGEPMLSVIIFALVPWPLAYSWWVASNVQRVAYRLVTDAGYESEENYHYLDDENMVPYIKPSNYEYAKTQAYAKAMAFRMAMEYRPEEDCYVCADGRTLSFIGLATSTRKSGFKSQVKRYECASCDGCPHLKGRPAVCRTASWH